VPFVQGEFRNTVHDTFAFLGFLGSAVVSKKKPWKDVGGALDDDVSISTVDDSPLKGLVSDRQSSSSENDLLPPGRGQVGHWEGEW